MRFLLVRTGASEPSQGSSILPRATLKEKHRFSVPFEPTVVGYPQPPQWKIAADARKRGDPGNRFIGNIPTANPCSNPPGQAWV
jgi:hypothetical protein